MNWVALADRAPDSPGKYLVFYPSPDPTDPLIAVAAYDPAAGWAFVPGQRIDAVSHWMPLPAAPAS